MEGRKREVQGRETVHEYHAYPWVAFEAHSMSLLIVSRTRSLYECTYKAHEDEEFTGDDVCSVLGDGFPYVHEDEDGEARAVEEGGGFDHCEVAAVLDVGQVEEVPGARKGRVCGRVGKGRSVSVYSRVYPSTLSLLRALLAVNGENGETTYERTHNTTGRPGRGSREGSRRRSGASPREDPSPPAPL